MSKEEPDVTKTLEYLKKSESLWPEKNDIKNPVRISLGESLA